MLNSSFFFAIQVTQHILKHISEGTISCVPRICHTFFKHTFLSGSIWIFFIDSISNIHLFFFAFYFLHSCNYVIDVEFTLMFRYGLSHLVWHLFR